MPKLSWLTCNYCHTSPLCVAVLSTLRNTPLPMSFIISAHPTNFWATLRPFRHITKVDSTTVNWIAKPMDKGTKVHLPLMHRIIGWRSSIFHQDKLPTLSKFAKQATETCLGLRISVVHITLFFRTAEGSRTPDPHSESVMSWTTRRQRHVIICLLCQGNRLQKYVFFFNWQKKNVPTKGILLLYCSFPQHS